MHYGTVRIFLCLGVHRGAEVAVLMIGIEVHLQTTTKVKAKNALVVHPPRLTAVADQVGRADT